jgi:protein ImuB
MMYVCLWSPSWSTGGASGGKAVSGAGLAIAELAPRIRVEREVIWADGRGLDARLLAERLLKHLAESGLLARAGVAAVPVVAELGARWGARPDGMTEVRTPFLVKERTGWGWRHGASSADVPLTGRGAALEVVVVEKGGEREWLGPLPVTALGPDPRLAMLLEGVGLHTVGALAVLEREAVEVRFGTEAVEFWRLARADDRRLLFRPVPPERPHGSIDFVDYVLTDPARLLFTANTLLGPLCDRLVGRGEHARSLRLVLPLANGEEWERTIRPARPTASRETWLRLIRGLLERLSVPDAVAGMRLEVGSTESAGIRQGDLFDRGFATAAAVEAAVARLAERQAVPVEAETDGHPLVERRARWVKTSTCERSSTTSCDPEQDGHRELRERRGLALQLLPEPRRLLAESVPRRDHEVPVRLQDRGGWREVAVAVGPDRISGGRWETEPFAREYYRCLTDEGVLLWVYRDGLDKGWYLHGWWD